MEDLQAAIIALRAQLTDLDLKYEQLKARRLEFEAKVTEADGQLTIDGNVELDRSKYNVRYGSGSFFNDLGDNLIHDNFTVGFSLVATAM